MGYISGIDIYMFVAKVPLRLHRSPKIPLLYLTDGHFMTVQQEGEQKRKNVQAELDILENNFQAKILANTQNISKSKANEELQ